MTPRYWTDVPPDVPGEYVADRGTLLRLNLCSQWEEIEDDYDPQLRDPAYIGERYTWFFGPLPTTFDEAADLDRECKVAFAEMYAACNRPTRSTMSRDITQLRIRFCSGERSAELLAAMVELAAKTGSQA